MKIFVDSADIQDINRFSAWGILDGVTTNPSLLVKAGVRTKRQAKDLQLKIAKAIFPRPLSIEVLSDQPQAMIKQARDIARWAKNVMVKITITDRRGESLLPVMYQLSSEGISLNVTTVCDLNQALLAAQALERGQKRAKRRIPFPQAVSVFAGRIANRFGAKAPVQLLHQLRTWLDFHHSPVEIIVGSIHTPKDLATWAVTGAHILTVPPQVLIESQISALTKNRVSAFMQDAKRLV